MVKQIHDFFQMSLTELGVKNIQQFKNTQKYSSAIEFETPESVPSALEKAEESSASAELEDENELLRQFRSEVLTSSSKNGGENKNEKLSFKNTTHFCVSNSESQTLRPLDGSVHCDFPENKSDGNCDCPEKKSDGNCDCPEKKSDGNCDCPEKKSDGNCDCLEKKSDGNCDCPEKKSDGNCDCPEKKSDGNCDCPEKKSDGNCDCLEKKSDGNCDCPENKCDGNCDCPEKKCDGNCDCPENKCDGNCDCPENKCDGNCDCPENKCDGNCDCPENKCDGNCDFSLRRAGKISSVSAFYEGVCNAGGFDIERRELVEKEKERGRERKKEEEKRKKEVEKEAVEFADHFKEDLLPKIWLYFEGAGITPSKKGEKSARTENTDSTSNVLSL